MTDPSWDDGNVVSETYYDHFDSSSNGDNDSDDQGYSGNFVWMMIWLLSVIIFLCFPFLFNERRRRLWLRRVRERRWISAEEFEESDPDWYTLAQRRRQEERRQELENQQRQFRVSKTQADEIREQFLTVQLEKYTMVSVKLVCLLRQNVSSPDHDFLQFETYLHSKQNRLSGKKILH
jgi:esterase/lipase